jgi:hypothetical protein
MIENILPHWEMQDLRRGWLILSRDYWRGRQLSGQEGHNMNYKHGLLSFKFASFVTAEFKHSFKVLDD